jgi:hypothetical protein
VLRSSSSVLFDSLVSGTSCSWFISGKESFFSSSITYVPLSVDSVTETDLVVSLVIGLLEYCAIFFLSHVFSSILHIPPLTCVKKMQGSVFQPPS